MPKLRNMYLKVKKECLLYNNDSKKMKIYLFYAMLVFSANTLFSQKTCESKEVKLEDLNSITKCTIESVKKSKSNRARQISVRVSAPKKRFLKKRIENLKSSSINNINSVGVSDVSGENEISESLKVKKLTYNLSNKLSIEEVRKTDKFVSVDEIPAFKGCKNTKGDERLDCFNLEMIKHIERYFSYPEQAIVKKIEGEVWVRFIIGKDGNISNIKAHASKGKEILKNEALRVVSNLPKFSPATKSGVSVPVKYGFPINFSLSE